MKLEELKNSLHFDEVIYIKNPYFYIRDYEDKGAIVILKKDKKINISYAELQDVCFECPDLEKHEGIIRMVIFSVDENDVIKNYSIAASMFKVLRSDILKYEKFISRKIEVE